MAAVKELIVDNFAGGGGASTGIELATGRSVDIAINHDPAAIAMHKANHPDTEHYCESVWNVVPRDVTKGRPVALCWLSPDCKHFSKAKGGKPVEKGIRGLAWVALRWAATVKPRVIILENVEEFKTWGPLLNGKPDPKRKGRTFKAFVNALKRQGYQVDWRELRACDFGAPTSRKRLFLIARCDGRPIVWPEPTHGDPNSIQVESGNLLPWRSAAEIIDWSLPCPSIFDRKKPLAENTLRRIARGIQRFVIDTPNPFIIKKIVENTENNDRGIVAPFITRIGQTGFGGDRMQYGAEQPLTTITTKAEHLLIEPFLVHKGQGETIRKCHPQPKSGRNKFALAKELNSRQTGHSFTQSMDNSYGSIAADVQNRAQNVSVFLEKYYAGRATTEMRSVDSCLNFNLAVPQSDGLLTSHLVKLRGTCQHGQAVCDPMPTITAGGLHVGEVRAFLMKYYGSDTGQSCDSPLHTIPTKDRFGLVTVYGQDYQIVDIGMRMLEPHELFAAQGFPSNYTIDKDADGKAYPKSAQVARCGNSVPPPFAQHLVRSNLPEICTGSGKELAFERYKEYVGQLELTI